METLLWRPLASSSGTSSGYPRISLELGRSHHTQPRVWTCREVQGWQGPSYRAWEEGSWRVSPSLQIFFRSVRAQAASSLSTGRSMGSLIRGRAVGWGWYGLTKPQLPVRGALLISDSGVLEGNLSGMTCVVTLRTQVAFQGLSLRAPRWSNIE